MRLSKRTGMLSKIFLCGFAVYAAVTLISLQLRINERKKEIEQLSNNINAQQIVNAELKEILDNGLNDDYVAREARDKLGYASPGERIFVDTSSK